MNKYLLSFFACLIAYVALAISDEPIDPKKPENNQHWDLLKKPLNFSFIDTDFSLSKHRFPEGNQLVDQWNTVAWRNESIHTQVAFWSNLTTYNGEKVKLIVSDLKSGKNKISKKNIVFAPIAYVLSDDPGDLKQGCGISIILDSTLVADRIQNTNTFTYEAFETRPLWLSIKVPENAKAGIYKGNIQLIIGDKKKLTLPYTVTIINQTLPLAQDWKFHLDLWQNPYSSARYYNLEPFSAEHFNSIKPNMERLANAGQKNITASIIYDPWNSQTYDKYGSMIKWIKKKDGTWVYDYTNFDKWINFMHDVGVKDYINCYSMIPWNLSFYYFDEETGKDKVLKAKPSEEIYTQHWLPFLKNFSKHLKDKGWFEKTTIAMDERPMEDMITAIKLIKSADKDFKISLAGYYHPELSDDIVDYSIPFFTNMDNEILATRQAKGYHTTFYTCCSEIFPNTFTSSGFYEPTWLMINSVQRGFDGYLRWAYDCWNKSPLTDTRFGPWLAGDTYLIYPDNETSIRFENMIDGIQQAEKIRILKDQFGSNSEVSKKLNESIAAFSNKDIKREDIPKQVKSLKKTLNSLQNQN